MVKKEVIVENETGLHARPASVFVQEAENYEAEITISKGEEEANAKSIMGVMSLGVDEETKITIQAEGSEAEEAVNNLVELVQNNFGEEE